MFWGDFEMRVLLLWSHDFFFFHIKNIIINFSRRSSKEIYFLIIKHRIKDQNYKIYSKVN